MTKPFPYTSLACRWEQHTACESQRHDARCSPYCVLHCACEHHQKQKPEESSETPGSKT